MRGVISSYLPPGADAVIDSLGEGHIHESYVVRASDAMGFGPLVLQRVNRIVFPNPERVVQTVARVTEHLCQRARLEGRDETREVLRLAPTRDGDLWTVDGEGEIWRAFYWISGAVPVATPDSPHQAREIGRAFGRFLLDLSELPTDAVEPALPHLRNADRHLEALDAAARDDPLRRASGVQKELAAIEARIHLTQAARPGLPVRLIHGDTKIDNVLFDVVTGQSLCVIDLDTVMPGPAPIDVGDFLRSLVRRTLCAGGRRRRRAVEYFVAGLAGYRDGSGGLLTNEEWEAVPDAVLTTAVALAARFLRDHLLGDRYFRVRRPGENLERCHQQLAVARWGEARKSQIADLVCSTAPHWP